MPPATPARPTPIRSSRPSISTTTARACARTSGPRCAATRARSSNHSEWATVVVEGHCDERGSEEYNLALGERRATSVKQYLTNRGIPSARIDTVSFGESKPGVQGHDESAWKWNRRGEFKVIKR